MKSPKTTSPSTKALLATPTIPTVSVKPKNRRVVTSDESLKIAPPPINRPLREACGKRCATCGAMRCDQPKRR